MERKVLLPSHDSQWSTLWFCVLILMEGFDEKNQTLGGFDLDLRARRDPRFHGASAPQSPLGQHRAFGRDIGLGLTHRADTVSYTHLRAHETDSYLVCRLLLEKKK